MWIRKIKLENFQKHESFEADFSDGVNILIGETDAGKSCIVRAFNWVLFGSSLKKARKVGSKITKVEIENSEGVVVRRIKSSSINAYEIECEGEVKRYDSIGRSIPDDVVKVLMCNTVNIDGEELNLNIAPQISLPFMIKESGLFRMKVINKLTGNDILDSVTQSFNKDNLKISRESRVIDEEKDERQKDLDNEVKYLSSIEEKFNNSNNIYISIVDENKKLDKGMKFMRGLILRQKVY